jgi:hypothetical protein
MSIYHGIFSVSLQGSNVPLSDDKENGESVNLRVKTSELSEMCGVYPKNATIDTASAGVAYI